MERNNDENQQVQQESGIKRFRAFYSSTVFLGVLVGVVIQLSTMGANFLVLTLHEKDNESDPSSNSYPSSKNIIIFSFLWSLFTSSMAFIFLGFIRSLIKVGYDKISPSHISEEESNAEIDEIILNVECRFVVGAMVGVCMAWTVTDLILGLKAQIFYSIIVLATALVWCQIMMKFFSRKTKSTAQRDVLSIALNNNSSLLVV